MPKIAYIERKFQPWQEEMIDKVNTIVSTYKRQGYNLTLRQVYYQFVARDWLPQRWADKATGSVNNQRSYDNLGELVNSARLAGEVDWSAIEDRTRELSGNAHWDDPAAIIDSAAAGFAIDKWENQPLRVEVWVEKDALEGVVAKPCRKLDIDYFSCRGYTSQTAMWDAGQRMRSYASNGQDILVLHLGDHDPSGIDMSRDIEDRLRLFMGSRYESRMEMKRIALNKDQINRYDPPPNPAKITDSRARSYIAEYGEQSWELDALEPSVIDQLITREVEAVRDIDIWNEDVAKQQRETDLLRAAHKNWKDVAEFLESYL